MMDACFDLNGATLQVIAEDGALLAPLLPYLAPLRAETSSGTAAGFVVNLARRFDIALPGGAEPVADVALPEGGQGCILVGDDGARWFVVPGEIALRIDADTAHLVVRPGGERAIGGSAGIHLIESVLGRTGQHLLHAAALALPGTDDALMMFAPSGAGKTTTALALALDGFGLLTDDASVVIPSGAGHPHRVWGLPRALKVHRRTAALLPQVGDLLADRWTREGEQALTLGVLRSVVDVGSPRPRTLVAAVALGPRVAGDHAIRRIRRSEALLHLAADNVGSAACGVPPDHLRRFECMSRIVADIAVYGLNVGSDLGALAPAVLSALRRDGHQRAA